MKREDGVLLETLPGYFSSRLGSRERRLHEQGGEFFVATWGRFVTDPESHWDLTFPSMLSASGLEALRQHLNAQHEVEDRERARVCPRCGDHGGNALDTGPCDRCGRPEGGW